MRNSELFLLRILVAKCLNSVVADSISARLIHKFIAQNAYKFVGDGSTVPNRVSDFSAHILYFANKKNLFSKNSKSLKTGSFLL